MKIFCNENEICNLLKEKKNKYYVILCNIVWYSILYYCIIISNIVYDNVKKMMTMCM